MEYCWRRENDETCEGPFNSREEAIRDAKSKLEGDSNVMVGTCSYPDPGAVVACVIDLDWLLEQMDEYVQDNVYPFEGDVFRPKALLTAGIAHHSRNADRGLRKALRDWAEKNLETDCWHSENEVKVDLKTLDPAGDM